MFVVGGIFRYFAPRGSRLGSRAECACVPASAQGQRHLVLRLLSLRRHLHDPGVKPRHRTHKVLCTFWNGSPEKWISIIADPANNAVIFKSHSGASFSVTASSPEKFYFLRGSPIIIAIKRASGGLFAFVSVGGTQTVGPIALTGITANSPSEIKFGDHNKENVQPMLWYGGRIDESTALSDSSILASFQSLSMFYQKLLLTPPGPPPEEA